MDLVVAADLVSKTLGSSTNALSRYGIEVKGAVGSTERLESLTGNLADVFGGQATAQSETMTGSLQQMNNAIGDAAESMGALFAPSIIAIASLFKGAAEKVDGFLVSMRDLNIEETLSITETDKLSDTLTRMKVELGFLDRSFFKDSPIWGGEIREEMTVLAGEIELVEQKLNSMRVAASSVFLENPMPDVIQDWDKYNETFEEAGLRTDDWADNYAGSIVKVKTSSHDFQAGEEKFANG